MSAVQDYSSIKKPKSKIPEMVNAPDPKLSAMQRKVRQRQGPMSLEREKEEHSTEKIRSIYRSSSNNRNNGSDLQHYVSNIGRLDSTTTSMQSIGGFTLNSQYKNVRTYSNLYPNPSKGFSLPTIAMKNSSIFYEKQRLGVGNPLNKPSYQPNSSMHMADFSR